jgi:hypothetical protein
MASHLSGVGGRPKWKMLKWMRTAEDLLETCMYEKEDPLFFARL